jgi:MoxR-like ATPase
MLSRGLFVLFEGVDRCGKTTQARRLAEALSAGGERAALMRFPDRETAIGKLIDGFLAQRAELDDRAVHLLFSANRWEKRCVSSASLPPLLLGEQRAVSPPVALCAAARAPPPPPPTCARHLCRRAAPLARR